MTGEDVFARVSAHLAACGAVARHVRHGPTRTSEESAKARGEPLSVGGKALLVRLDDRFAVLVLRACDRLDGGKARRHFKSSGLRFATPAELKEVTGLVPGSLPPFGRPLFALDLYVDPAVVANDRIAFNAGSLTDSLVVPTADWLRAAKPDGIFAFAEASSTNDHPAAPRV